MVADSSISTHADPVWRDRTNFIVRLDLTAHGLPGYWEQCWTRTDDEVAFEMCCIPYFTYGISVGYTLAIDQVIDAHSVIAKGGHRTIRLAFTDDAAAHQEHDRIHDVLCADLGFLVEFRGNHYASIDVADDRQRDGVIDLLTPLVQREVLLWEWADPAADLD